MKLTKEENAAFAAIGEALCGAKDCSKRKKENLPSVAKAIAANHAKFVEGVTIGGYRFTLTVREELSAVRI